MPGAQRARAPTAPSLSIFTRSDMSFHDLHTNASIFIGADTFLGPIYLGYGVGDDGNSAAFLYIGQLF